MKKTIALIIALVVILTCFAGCKKGSFEGGAVVTDFAGQNLAIVTQESGGIVRNEAGNVVVLVTDADGYNVKDDKGENVTQAIAIEHAIVIGTRVELADYAINIPDGWSNADSYNGFQISKDGTNDIISLTAYREEKLADVQANNDVFIKGATTQYKGAKTQNTTMKIAGKDASFVSAYVSAEQTGSTGSYVGFITFTHQGVIFNCMLTSDRDLAGQMKEITDILNTIEFIH